MTTEHRDLMQTAYSAAQRGADVLRNRRNALSVDDADEKGTHDFVTAVDRESEEAIISLITHRHPDHSILAEESGYREQRSAWRWIIDPLDGTTNFIHDYPQYAVSVAVQHEGRVVAGVIVDVTRNETFSAYRGGGAWLNEERIRVSTVNELHTSLILTGFPFKANKHMEDFITVFRSLLPKTSGIRRAGSAALDLAHIACGRADGFWEFGLSAWDIAAGAVLVEEAGGKVADVDGGKRYLESGHVLCGNKPIYDALYAELRSHFPVGHFHSE